MAKKKAATKTTKKASKKENDGKKKRPTGYLLYCKEQRPKVVKENPSYKAPDILRELGKMWSEENDKVKLKFNNMSKNWTEDDE